MLIQVGKLRWRGTTAYSACNDSINSPVGERRSFHESLSVTHRENVEKKWGRSLQWPRIGSFVSHLSCVRVNLHLVIYNVIQLLHSSAYSANRHCLLWNWAHDVEIGLPFPLQQLPVYFPLAPITTDVIASQNSIVFIIVKSDYLVELLVNTAISHSDIMCLYVFSG
jgi:hypothetical protein